MNNKLALLAALTVCTANACATFPSHPQATEAASSHENSNSGYLHGHNAQNHQNIHAPEIDGGNTALSLSLLTGLCALMLEHKPKN